MAEQVAAQASGSSMPSTMLMPKRSTKPGLSMMAVGGQVGDDAVVADVEVAAIDAAGLQRLDDVAGVLVGALVLGERLAGLVEELREVGLEPVAALGRVAQVAAGLAVDPVAHVDPVADLVGALAVPGQVLARGGRCDSVE